MQTRSGLASASSMPPQRDRVSAQMRLRAMGAALWSYWREAAGYQRFLYLVGALLMLSGVFHAGVLLVDGGGWAGPLSWRKPIVFGLSFGVTAVSLAWIMSFLPRRRVRGWLLLGTFGVASLGEVFLITMQAWRGVPSHFNANTTFDERVFGMMGSLVAVVGVVIAIVALWTFVGLRTRTSLAWAIRIGMLFLVAAQLFGALIVINEAIKDAGPTTEASIFGAAGAMKAPHALTLHGVQVLPVLAWLLLFVGWSERQRTGAVILAAVGYTGVIVVGALQTFRGLALLDLNAPTAAALVLSVVVLAGSYGMALAALWRSSTPAASETAIPELNPA